MDWQAALYARFLADAPLAALLADWDDTKTLFWVERAQGSPLPALTLQTISDGRAQHLKGFEGLQEKRVQADVWAATYALGRQITEAFLAAAVPAYHANGSRFGRAEVALGPRDLAETQAGAPTIFRTSMDLIFNHNYA